MLEYLRLRKFTTVTNSIDIRTDLPDLVFAPGFTLIAGRVSCSCHDRSAEVTLLSSFEMDRHARLDGLVIPSISQ